MLLLSESMPKCQVVRELTWQNGHNKQSVLLQVQGHTAFFVVVVVVVVVVVALCSSFKC